MMPGGSRAPWPSIHGVGYRELSVICVAVRLRDWIFPKSWVNWTQLLIVRGAFMVRTLFRWFYHLVFARKPHSDGNKPSNSPPPPKRFVIGRYPFMDPDLFFYFEHVNILPFYKLRFPKVCRLRNRLAHFQANSHHQSPFSIPGWSL